MLHENYEFGGWYIDLSNMQVLQIRLTLIPLLLILVLPVIVLFPQYNLRAGNSTANYTG